jgi:hypothetical protein
MNEDKKELRIKLLELEQYYLDMISDKYNINLTAGSTLGYQHTEEAKARIGLSSLGRVHSDKTLALFRERIYKEETLAKFRARRHPEEIRNK